MKPSFHRADEFNQDFDRWYLREAGGEIAEHFLAALQRSLQLLLTQPELGRRRNFPNPALSNLRSFKIEAPFNKLLIFYRYNSEELIAERLLHGARDLPRRLAEPPSA